VYANDPEERFAWIPSTHLDRICGAFVREGVVLPEPGDELLIHIPAEHLYVVSR